MHLIKKTVQETQKWLKNFSRPSGFELQIKTVKMLLLDQ